MNRKIEIDVEELKKGGVVKLKEKDRFSAWVRAVCNNMDAKKLRRVADLAEKYGKGYMLFSTRQFPIIPHVRFKDIGIVKDKLEEIDLMLDRCGKRVRNADVCYDANLCPYAVTNPISLGERIDQFWREDPGGFKIKISISGCERQCTSPRVLADVGFVGTERNGKAGYDVYLGGRLGLNPFIGIRMAELLTENAAVKFLKNYIDLIRKEGREGERSADLIHRLGEGRVRKSVTEGLSEECETDHFRCETRQGTKIDRMILRIRATNGEVNSRQARKIADIAEKYGLGFVHFPVRGGPEIPGIEKEALRKIEEELKKMGLSLLEGGFDNLQTCFGGYCSNGNFDCQAFLRRVEGIAEKLDLNHLNITISASGCPNSCGISHLSDIGFVGVVEPEVDKARCNGCGICVKACRSEAIRINNDLAEIDLKQCKNCDTCIKSCPFDAIYEKRKGVAILIGGRGPHFMHDGQTGETRLAEKLVDFQTEEQAFRITKNILRLLKKRNKNASELIDEIGLEKIKEMVAIRRGQAPFISHSRPFDEVRGRGR